MPSWDRVLSLYIDVTAFAQGRRCLLDRLTSSASLQQAPTAIQGDKFKLRLYFRARSSVASGSSTSVQLDPGFAIIYAGKWRDGLDSEELMFLAENFVEVEADGLWYYESTLNLNTEELQELFESQSEKTLLFITDIEVQNGSGDPATFQFETQIRRQAYAGEASPTPATPAYPAPSSILTSGNVGVIDIPDGQDHVDVDLTAWSLVEAPTCVLPAVIKPNAAAANLMAVGVSTITNTGFRIHFSADAPTGTYKATYLFK